MAQFYGYKRLKSPEDWKGLANSWKPGRSAFELAYAWQRPKAGFPTSVLNALKNSNYAALHGLTPQQCVVEFPVFLDSPKAPSMNDIMVYATNQENKLVVIAVEGKATEPFGDRVNGWVRDDKLQTPDLTKEPKPTRLKRLSFLSDYLGTKIKVNSTLRYQLLHRTVSAVSEAQLRGAEAAVVIIHAFGTLCADNWSDYCDFGKAIGTETLEVGKISAPVPMGNAFVMPTYFLWCQDSVLGDKVR